MRDQFLFKHTLNLRYETTADQLRYLLAQIRELLYQHPRVDSTAARIRFVASGHPRSMRRFSPTSSRKDYACVPRRPGGSPAADHGPRRVERQRFCLPLADPLHDQRTGGSTRKRAARPPRPSRSGGIEGELPFPDHRPGRVSQLDGTLEYPPKGSVLERKESDR